MERSLANSENLVHWKLPNIFVDNNTNIKNSKCSGWNCPLENCDDFFTLIDEFRDTLPVNAKILLYLYRWYLTNISMLKFGIQEQNRSSMYHFLTPILLVYPWFYSKEGKIQNHRKVIHLCKANLVCLCGENNLKSLLEKVLRVFLLVFFFPVLKCYSKCNDPW